MALQDSGIFIASSLIADTPEKDKENAEPTGDTPAGRSGRRSGEGGSRSARKSLLGRRRSSMGRRMSGFGGGGFDVDANQSELASMYASIIKLNSQNKITREGCWGHKLIDFMDRVILDEGGQMPGSKVNFQKASCTLDASVKIYSHRVDAAHIISYSLLDNLNRGDKSTAEDGSGAAVGSSERSARLGVHETLKKAEQLDQSETDRAFKMDPMFHKMSKIFDEAGSKGMLLNNLSVSDGCKVSFDSAPPTAPAARRVFARPGGGGGDEGEGNEEKSPEDKDDGAAAKAAEEGAQAAAEADRGMTDIRDLRATLFSICGDLSSLALCPQLQEFREEIAEIEEGPRESKASFGGGGGGGGGGGVESNGAAGEDSDSDGGDGGGFDDVPESGGASFDGGGCGEDDGVPDFVAGGGSEDADPFHADNGEGFGGGGSGGGMSFLGSAGDDGDAGFGSGSGGADGGRGSMESSGTAAGAAVSLEDRLCDDMKIVNDDYAFYDTGALAAAAVRSSSNNWAGASHWKFVGVKKKRPERKKSSEVKAEDGGEDAAFGGTAGEGGGARKARGKRRPPAIDFDAPPVADKALAPPPKPKSRARRGKDITLLSEEYVARALKAAEDASSNYALPENAGFKTKDLAELFLRKGAFTKRWAAGEAGGASGGERVDLQGFHDSTGGGGGGGDLLFADANDGYTGGDDFGDDDDDDDDMGSEGFHFAGGFDLGGAEGGGGPEIGPDGVFVDNFEGQGLLSAGRRVEKISVNYARKAKKVDVRRLKGDLWRKIDREFQSDAAAAAAAGVAQDGRQKEVEGDSAESEEVKREDDAENEDTDHTDAGKQGGEGKGTEELAPGPEVVDMTFSDIVLDVASREEQSGVTVPFYFICLLHLANEKGLKLEGRDDLLDFSVESDPVEEGFH